MGFERAWAYGFSASMVLAVASPAFLLPSHDGFPLSTYPMFSHGRRSARAKIVHVVAIGRDGRRSIPPPSLVASEEVMQTFVSTRRSVKSGRAPDLCREVAARLAREGSRWEHVVEVQVRTDWFDAVRYFSLSRRPKRTKVHARCPIRRK